MVCGVRGRCGPKMAIFRPGYLEGWQILQHLVRATARPDYNDLGSSSHAREMNYALVSSAGSRDTSQQSYFTLPDSTYRDTSKTSNFRRGDLKKSNSTVESAPPRHATQRTVATARSDSQGSMKTAQNIQHNKLLNLSIRSDT